MKLVVNVRRSQLRGVLEELVRSFPDMDIVINIEEEESDDGECQEITLGYQRITREQLKRLGKET